MKYWIVDYETFKVVRAERELGDNKIFYVNIKSGKNTYPYYPTVGNGNRSYWGDGPTYKTKKEAIIAQQPILQKEMRSLTKKKMSKIMSEPMQNAVPKSVPKGNSMNLHDLWLISKYSYRFPWFLPL